MLTFDVGVIFNIGEDVQSPPDAGLREILSDGIDAAALGTANHPSETVNHAQGLFNTNSCCHDRNNLASAPTATEEPLNVHFLRDEHSAAKNKHYIA
jgi:poly-gamma-glutamate capsule biosynthesis protein CapA/YwtB (metallophosphatase superfamily)